jgi:hypothetical protein
MMDAAGQSGAGEWVMHRKLGRGSAGLLQGDCFSRVALPLLNDRSAAKRHARGADAAC